MVAGPWVSICFGSGTQQHIMTITTLGIAEDQLAPTPPHNHRHPRAAHLSCFYHESSVYGYSGYAQF